MSISFATRFLLMSAYWLVNTHASLSLHDMVIYLSYNTVHDIAILAVWVCQCQTVCPVSMCKAASRPTAHGSMIFRRKVVGLSNRIKLAIRVTLGHSGVGYLRGGPLGDAPLA